MPEQPYYAEWPREKLIAKIEELQAQLRAQHSAVDEAARNWRKIGYQAGYSDGYNDAEFMTGDET